MTRPTVPCTDVTTLLAYEAGHRDGLYEAAGMLDLSAAEIRLHAGEMTAQEMRSVQAVLKWRAAVIREAGDV